MLKVVSGGQTGVDRLALGVAIECGLEHGGWCPEGRRSEDGKIPERYKLTETTSKNYAVRTEQNIVDSDGTLVFFDVKARGGTALTINLAKKHGKPNLSIDMSDSSTCVFESIKQWIIAEQITVLNVAGPRLSSSPELPDRIRPVLNRVFDHFKSVG